MKKKTMVLLAALLPLAAVLYAGWVLYSVPRNAHQYLQQSPRMINILGALKFVQFRDLPGYAGSLGRDDALEAVIQAAQLETDAWNEMSSMGYRLTNQTLLGKCVRDIHDEKMNFLKRSASFSKATVVDTEEVNRLFSDEKMIAAKNSECWGLALKASKLF